MTRLRVIWPAAQLEIDHHAEYLATHADEVTAERFLDAVDETVANLLKFPGSGSFWVSDHPQLQGIRKRRIVGFDNHLLFYRYDERSVEILHLFHGAQDIEARFRDPSEGE